jgi:hypothetical protein
MEWFKDSWGYLVLIGGLIAAGFRVVQTTLAAERDRRALKNSQLESDKLALEVGRLRNDPKVVEDRRAIYERLRLIVGEITRDGAVTNQSIYDLHEVRHDAEFRFPPDVVNSIKDVLHAAVGLHVTGSVLKPGPGRWSTEEWQKHVQDDHDALMAIAAFEQEMVDIFRSHLSL